MLSNKIIKYVERLSKEWCWITGKELTKMIETENFQWIWGVFSAFPESVTKDDALKYELPKADGNEKIWKKSDINTTSTFCNGDYSMG